MSQSQLSPGTVVDGAYTVDAVVRARAGATTYNATDAQGASVWVTLYDGSCFTSGLALERSLRELRQLKNVVSPRVLGVMAAGKHGDGVFEVTKPGPDQTLAEHLGQGALSMPEAAGLAVQIGEALLEAQRVGVIHRNLGADVVFPSPDGVRVGGFAIGEPQPRGAGPLMTIAPEQVQGKVVDQRTLIYNVAALMHWMLSGTPLFAGSPEEILSAHENQVPSESIDAKLRRALGKDPRMRPMMLKQFLQDIAQMGGVEPPKLATRISAPSIGSGPKAPIAAPKAPDAAVSRPSSRGWTMFMKAQDDEPEAKPAEPAPPPSKPSTRGWTMFMKAQDDDSAAADAPAASTPAAEPAPAPEPEQAPESQAQPEAGGEGAPSTRGWTMFMKASGGETAGEDPPAEEPPADEPPAEAEGAPSTRGWTMFTKDEEAAAGQSPTAPADAPAEASADAPADAPADAAAPSSRGWTMFMEPGEKPAEEQAAAPETAPEAASAASAEAADAPEGELPKKRGWTMFMNAPLEDLPQKEPGAPEAPQAPTGSVEAADKKGWTVFGAPALERPDSGDAAAPQADAAAGAAEASAPSRGKTLMVTNPAPVPEPPAAADELPDTALAGAKTLVNTSEPVGTPVQRGKTMLSTAAPSGEKPDTMYFKKGEVEPEGGVSPRAPTVRDVPTAGRPAEERVARADAPVPQALPAVAEPTDLAPAKSSNVMLYAIAGAVAVAAAVGAYFAFG